MTYKVLKRRAGIEGSILVPFETQGAKKPA